MKTVDYNIITDYSKIDRKKWSDFVKNHSEGNIFQTPEYFLTLKSQEGIEPFSFFLVDNNDIITGVLIGEYIFENKFYKYFTKRAVIRGGPLIIDNLPKLLNLIIKEYDKQIGQQLIYSEFRPVGSNSTSGANSFCEFIPEERLNIIFDLNKKENELFNLMHPARRRQIQRGYRRGLAAEIFDTGNEELISECYEILSNLYKKINLPVFKKSFFITASVYLKKHFKIFTVRLKKELVGFRFVLCFKNLIYDWFAASKEEHYDKYPNDILPWEVIRWGANNGYKYFDFGGAGKPDENYGVRDYKMKFGGDLITTYRYKIIHKPVIMSVSSAAFKLYKKLKNSR